MDGVFLLFLNILFGVDFGIIKGKLNSTKIMKKSKIFKEQEHQTMKSGALELL